MIQVGDVVRGIYPSVFTSEERGAGPWRKGKKSSWSKFLEVRPVVEWIHPRGRFAVIRFEFPASGFCYREAIRLKSRQEMVG